MLPGVILILLFLHYSLKKCFGMVNCSSTSCFLFCSIETLIAFFFTIVVTVGPKDTPIDVVLEKTYDAKAGIGMPEL